MSIQQQQPAAPAQDAPASTPGAEGAAPETAATPVEKRLQDQSRIIAALTKKVEQLEASKTSAGSEPAPSKYTAVEEMMRRAEERDARAKDRAIRAALSDAASELGVNPDLARKLMPEIVREVKPRVDDVDDSVSCEVEPGVVRRPVEAIKMLLERDDWRHVVPVKSAPRAPHGRPSPAGSRGTVPQPNEFGVYSAAALRRGAS